MESDHGEETGLPPSLLQLLSNSLILYHTAPYLSPYSLLTLGGTSKSFKSLIHDTPGVFRYLNLTQVKSARFEIAAIDHGGEVWRNIQMDENVTEDDFYGGPLQGIFNKLRKRHILQGVQTMILDGLSVTSDMVSEIILHDFFNVRILSIREVQNLNERKLQQALVYAVRNTRAENTPKLQGLYIFGSKDSAPPPKFRRHATRYISATGLVDTAPDGVMHAQGAQIGAEWNRKSCNSLADEMERGDKWYQSTGKVITKPPSLEWAIAMRACEGIISFDAVLCQGPRHSVPVTENKQNTSVPWYRQHSAYTTSRVASCAVGGCDGCGTAPEGYSQFGVSSISQFPLLAPPPLHSSAPKSAKTPFSGFPEKKFLARCLDCLRNRYCESCHKWWCEDCYEVPNHPSYGLGSPQPTQNGQADKKDKVKVHMGLCIESCLVAEMMSGAGSNGMWG